MTSQSVGIVPKRVNGARIERAKTQKESAGVWRRYRRTVSSRLGELLAQGGVELRDRHPDLHRANALLPDHPIVIRGWKCSGCNDSGKNKGKEEGALRHAVFSDGYWR